MSKASKLIRAVALSTVFAAASGCSMGPQRIGPEADNPELKGETTQTQVFSGGPQQNVIYIPASSLKENVTYDVTGRLVIEGNLANNVDINVHDGELLIRGNVGDESDINVSQPLVTHTKTTVGPGYCYGVSYDGKPKYGFNPSCVNTETIVDGLKYDDKDPAVEISGSAGTNLKINTPGKIVINGQTVTNKNQVGLAPKT